MFRSTPASTAGRHPVLVSRLADCGDLDPIFPAGVDPMGVCSIARLSRGNQAGFVIAFARSRTWLLGVATGAERTLTMLVRSQDLGVEIAPRCRRVGCLLVVALQCQSFLRIRRRVLGTGSTRREIPSLIVTQFGCQSCRQFARP